MRARCDRPLGSTAAQGSGRCLFNIQYNMTQAAGATSVLFYRTNAFLTLLLILSVIFVVISSS